MVIHGLVNFGVWQSLSWVRLGQGKRDTDPWVGGGPYMVNAVVIHYFRKKNVTEFGRLEKLSRVECHNVTN